MSDRVDGRCAICEERQLTMTGTGPYSIECGACKTGWTGPNLGDLVESAIMPSFKSELETIAKEEEKE